MDKLTGSDVGEERLPLWLAILVGVAVVGVIAVLLVFFFGSSSL